MRVPLALEIGDQRRAEMAIGLIARVGGEIAAKQIERLLADADGAAVRRGADRARTGQTPRPRDRAPRSMSPGAAISSQIRRPSGLSQSSRRSYWMAWRAMRSPVKRGRRRLAAPGMMPSLRAGKRHERVVGGEHVVHGQQDLAMAADGEAVDRRDPGFFDRRRRARRRAARRAAPRRGRIYARSRDRA